MSVWRAAAIYVVAAIVLTYPLALSLTSTLAAPQGAGDPYLNLWILGWGLRAWTTDPFSVLSGEVFDANIFFPAQGTLAYSDHFLLQALALSPIYWITGDAVLCYNLLLLASIALSGLAMHLLVRELTGSTAAALTAGLVWAAWPYRTAHFVHIQLQALYFMPLALLFLHRVMAGRRWRDAMGLGLTAALQAIASVYYGVMTAVVLAVAAVVLVVVSGQPRGWRVAARLIAAAAVGIALTVPVLLPYVRSQQTEGFGRTLFEAANHAASVQAYTQVPEHNLLYGQTGMLVPRPPMAGERDRRHVEHQLFPGLMLVGLAFYGAVRRWRSDARAVLLTGLTLTVVGVVLSLGPDGVRSLYAALHEHVYGFQAIRAPARFAVIAVLGLALLAALAIQTMSRRAMALVIAALCLEYVNAPVAWAVAPPRSTDTGRWLAAEPLPGAVLYLPIGLDLENTPYMVESLEHGRPIVNGYSGQRPAFYPAIVEMLATMPSPEALATLHEMDVRFVISPAPLAGAGEAASPLVERARLDNGIVYELRWTEAARAALEMLPEIEPPPPGPLTFEDGERLTYEAFWEGGPVDLPAGTITLTARHDAAAGEWHLETRAETADWVSVFFHARDRFVTRADGQLLPIVHDREIREGRRAVDRRYVYDRQARTVDTGAMTLPLGPPAARDALTAFYYVRTLPLPAGAAIEVPINEAGRPLILALPPPARDTIVHGAARVPAWRLSPRLMRRLERRRPVTLTLWLSADDRRVPLRAIVDAGFGQVRLELVAQEP